MIIKNYTLEEALDICENGEWYDADAITVLADYVGMLPEWEASDDDTLTEKLYELITEKARAKYNAETPEFYLCLYERGIPAGSEYYPDCATEPLYAPDEPGTYRLMEEHRIETNVHTGWVWEKE